MELKTFIDDWLSSWTGNKPNELLSYYADNVFYLDPATPTGISNKENLKQYFVKLLSKNPNWIWKSEEINPTERGCALKWKAEIPVGGGLVILFGLDIVEISDWKITRNEVYFDRIPWVEAIQKQNK